MMRRVVIVSLVRVWCKFLFLSSFLGILVDPLWLVVVYSEVVGGRIRLELSVAQVFNFYFLIVCSRCSIYFMIFFRAMSTFGCC